MKVARYALQNTFLNNTIPAINSHASPTRSSLLSGIKFPKHYSAQAQSRYFEAGRSAEIQIELGASGIIVGTTYVNSATILMGDPKARLSFHPVHLLEIYQVIWIPSDFIGLVPSRSPR